MAALHSIEVPLGARCALCGRRDPSLFSFPLLADTCRKVGVRLKRRDSDYFGTRCARIAFASVQKR